MRQSMIELGLILGERERSAAVLLGTLVSCPGLTYNGYGHCAPLSLKKACIKE
jgi:hypothetical protein